MEGDCKNYVIERFKAYSKSDIIITPHAASQADFRKITIDEVKENIKNPIRLMFAGKQAARLDREEKFDCYFVYSNTRCHRYIVVFSKDLIVCTIIGVNRRWQRVVERYAKI